MHRDEYLKQFFLNFILFTIISFCIGWIDSEVKQPWYTYVVQGVLFGFLMPIATFWLKSTKKKKSEEDK